MNLLELQIQSFLTKAVQEPQQINEALVTEFGELCKSAFRKQFMEERENKFRLRMSNIGRPSCVLQNAKLNSPKEPLGYNHILKMLIGDLAEAALITVIKAAGVEVESTNTKVSLSIGGNRIDGSTDLSLREQTGTLGVYDIKSASAYSFNNKFQTWETVLKDDPFGYGAQGFGYAKDTPNARFRGWIVFEKATGEVKVVTTPTDEREYAELEALVLSKAESTIQTILHSDTVEKLPTQEETWYGKPTGNTVLNRNCVFCEYKMSCFPNAIYMKNPKSKGSTDWRWYTDIKTDAEAK